MSHGSQHELTALNTTPPYGNVAYAYLGDGPLAAVSSSTDGVYTLGYDALGRTVRRASNGQTTNVVYDGPRAILQKAWGSAS
ncbi:MAG: hypothetical protein ACR2ID_01525 [Chthoniobacterales bacterium]